MSDPRVFYLPVRPEKPIPIWVGYASVGICAAVLVLTIIVVSVLTPPGKRQAYGPAVITKQQPRFGNISKWCFIEFNISHVGRSKNQSPSQWSRFFMPLTSSSSPQEVIQITPYDEIGNITAGGLKSNIIEGYASYDTLYVGLEYWGEAPWRIYVGQNQGECLFAIF